MPAHPTLARLGLIALGAVLALTVQRIASPPPAEPEEIVDNNEWARKLMRLGCLPGHKKLLDIEGRPKIIVGDSTALNWPDEFDFAVYPGSGARCIAQSFAGLQFEKRYELMVIAAGHFDLLHDVPPEEVFDALDDLRRTGETVADRVVVLEPNHPGIEEITGYDWMPYRAWFLEHAAQHSADGFHLTSRAIVLYAEQAGLR